MIEEKLLERAAAANPEPRCPVIIVADTSGSMAGARIDELNRALPILKSELLDDPLAAKRVEIAILSISPVQIVTDFVSPAAFTPPMLRLGNDTPMGAAMQDALRHVRARLRALTKEGIRVYRPWIILISDGDPTDDIVAAAAEVAAADRNNEINVFAIGVAGADLAKLSPFTHKNQPLPLDGLKFREFFQWVTANVKSVTRSATHSGGDPTGQAPLTPVKGWIGA